MDYNKLLGILPSPLRRLAVRFREIILYGLIGSLSSGLDFLVYTILVFSGLYFVTANCISVLIGIGTSFLLNRKYNFKVTDNTGKRFAIFLTIGLLGLMMSNAILYYLSAVLQFSSIVSKIISIVLVVFFQFLANKFITFKSQNLKAERQQQL